MKFYSRPRTFAACLCAGAFVLSSAAAAAAPVVTGIRHWTGPDHTRIVLDLSTPAAFSQLAETRPRSVTVRLDGASLASGVSGFSIADGAVAGVSVQAVASGVEVTVALEIEAVCSVFPMEPLGEKPDRLVIDVARPARPAEIPEPPPPVRRIVIDPGHGGDDLGARGFGRTVEKTITLDIAKRVARLVDGPDDREVAVLTRERDEFVPLGRRVLVARDARADLFVSIHANSSPDPSGHGAEVYFVSLSGATDVAAQELADKENAADLVGGTSEAAKEEILASEDLLGILLDMTQSETVERSSRLAESVLDALRRRGRIPVRAVKQAGFRVLRSVVVPSILVEVGFVTNRDEARRLLSPAYRERIAEGIAAGIEGFLALDEKAAPFVEHVVAEGETLSQLAERHRMSTEDLAQLNKIAIGPLRVGQKLKVPR